MKPLSVAESRRALLGSVSEDEWEATVEEALKRTGHLIAHFRPARTNSGWRTAMSGHPGFPDLVAVGPPPACTVKVAELKSLTGITTAAQCAWLGRVRAGGALVAVLRPGDHEALAAFVRAGARI